MVILKKSEITPQMVEAIASLCGKGVEDLVLHENRPTNLNCQWIKYVDGAIVEKYAGDNLCVYYLSDVELIKEAEELKNTIEFPANMTYEVDYQKAILECLLERFGYYSRQILPYY